MIRTRFLAAVTAVAALHSGLMAQPEIISLGSGTPISVTPDVGGTYFVGGSGVGGVVGVSRWTLTGGTLTGTNHGGTGGGRISNDGLFMAATVLNNTPQISGNTATGVSPPFSTTPVLVPSPLAVTESRGARWSAASGTFQNMGGLPIVPSLMVYGSGSSGGSTGNFISPNGISQSGRFTVGLGYISTYNSAAGTTISANTFQWRPWIWDSEANAGAGAYTILPTPFRTSTNTWRRRTGNAYAVSNDGLVIVGAQEHNVATTPTADPDGGRPVVWRWNPGTSEYEMSFLPNGVNGSGFPYTVSTTPSDFLMNAAGTVIVGVAISDAGSSFIAKWTWDAGTSTWNAPITIGTGLAAPASWLPAAVTNCGVPPTLKPTGMSDDGNTIVGVATYSTCGSFMSGGWIWTSTTGVISDWYDSLSEDAGPAIAANYGPIGDNGDPNRGLPRLGFPTAISTDGNAVVGFQGGTQLIPGAPSWIVLNTGGPGCVLPVVTLNPTATVNLSACSSSIILNVSASGTLPISYHWQKNGVDLADGTTPSGSVIVGATSFQMRVNQVLSPADVGMYQAFATGACGTPVPSTMSNVQLDPAFTAPANDICSGAQAVVAGVNVLAPAQSVCGAFTNDPISGSSCFAAGTKADRWFVFTPSTDGDYRIETCGATYDTVLSVFPDCTSGSELACNNDYTTGPTSGCTSTRSRINSIQLTAGIPYYIRIAAPLNAFISDTSTMNLSIFAAPLPAANDNCTAATAAVIGANPFDTTEATNDGNSTCNTALGRDIWFSYTPTARGSLRLTTCPGTTWNTVLNVFDFCFGNELSCNDNANVTGCTNQSIIDYFPVNAGQSYLIRVGTNTNSALGGPGVLTVAFRCGSDFNADGSIGSQDFFDFVSAFFTDLPTADFNRDSVINSQDFFDFLSAFLTGC